MTDVAAVGIAVETGQIQQGINKLTELAQQGPKVEQSMAGIATESKRVAKSLADLGIGAGDGLKKTGEAAQKAATGLKASGTAAREAVTDTASLARAISGLTVEEEKHIRKLIEEANSLRMTRGEMEAYRAAQRGMGVGAQEISRAVGQKIEALKAEQAALTGANDSMFALVRGGVQAFVGSALVNYSLQAAKALYEASAASQRLQTTLNYATGGNGAREMEYVRGVANKLGLEFQSTAVAYAQFQAASKGTALEGEKARGVFESIAKASAVLGLSAADTSGVLLALQQMISKGTVQAEELRGQLGERLPGAFQSAAKAMGVTTAELGKMLEQGKVIADDFLPKFAEQLEKDMGQAAEKAVDRLDAAVNRYTNSWQQLKQTIGDSGVNDASKAFLNAATNDMDAFTESMLRAKSEGASSFGQLASGLLTLGGRALNLQMVSDGFRSNAEQADAFTKKLIDADKELATLEARGAKTSSNLMLRQMYADAVRARNELYEVKDAQDALKGYGGSYEDTGRQNNSIVAGMVASDEARAKRVKEIEQDVQKILNNSAGIADDYQKKLKTLQDAQKEGILVGEAYTKAVSNLAKETWDASTAGKEEAKAKREAASASKSAESAMRKEQNAYDNLINSIKLKIEQNKEEILYGRKMTDSERLRFLLSETNAKKISEASKQRALNYIDELESGERLLKLRQDEAEEFKDYWAVKMQVIKADDEHQRVLRQLNETLNSLQTQTKNETDRLALEAKLIGATNLQREIELQLYDLKIEKEKKLKEIRETVAIDEGRDQRIADTEAIYAQKAANVAGQAYLKEWRSTVDQVENIFVSGFADMMNNGKSGWESFCKSLKTSFYTMVAKEIYAMFAKPFVVQLVGSFIGMTGGGSAVQAGASGMGNMLGSLSNMSSMWKAISGGLNASAQLGSGFMQTAADWAYKYGMNSVGGMIDSFRYGMMSTSSWSSALASAQAGGAELAGLIGGSLMNGFAGYGISRMLSGGYSAGGWVNTAAGIASIIPGIGPIAGVVGGTINRAFGRKLKDAGIEGEFGGETGFEGRQFEFYKGGWFRSDKTKYKDLEESTRAGFADQFTVLKGSVEAMGESLGLGSDLLTDFTYKMKLSLKGLSEEEAAKKIQEEFDKIANSMGDVVLTTKDYNKEGETQIEALTRLSTSLVWANEWFKAVGDTLYTVGLAGADMASDLMDAFGGADKFAAATSNYYDKFFTDQEKVANQTRLLDEQLKKLGVETMPASREAFRDYINSIDVTTEAGQKLYASLLQMADVFDLIYSSAENIAGLKEDLNVQLMRAKGDDEGATRLEREKQLRELEKYKDPELVRLQVEVWAAEDKSKKDAEAKQTADDMAEKLAAAQKAAQDLALKNLEAAISREKEYWNQFSADAKDALSKASSYWTLVTDAAKNLRGSTEDISSWNAAQGMVFIEQAVANARKGLGLSDYDATKSAIDSATSGLNIDKYATQAELDYDKKVLAGQLDELGDFAGLAKSDAQKQIDLATDQIKRLDDTLKFWQDYGKEQVNATLSVTEAVNALYKLLDPKEQERIRKEEAEKAGLTGGSKPPTYTGGGTLGGTVTGSSSGTSIYGYDKDGRALYSDGSIGARPGEYDKSGVSKNASLSEEQWERLKSGQSVYDGYWLGGKQYGLESYYWDEQKQAWLKKGSFAVGTNFVPYDMTANIHQGERIIPAADNRALIAAVQGGGNSLQLAEVVAELRSVKEELQAIKASASISAEQNRKATDVLNQVTDGGNGMRSITMNKVLTVRTT